MEKKNNYVEIGNVGKIIIPEKFKRKIDVLHKEIGATEWSGILVYKTLVKSVKSLKDLVFRAEDIFLMDIGTAAATTYKYDGDVVDMYDNIPQAMEMNIGHCHSHHSMSTSFSNVDMEEIAENTKHYNYYLSLIVNFDGKYKCKLAIPTKVETKAEYTLRDRDGKTRKVTVSENKDVVILGELSVTMEYKNSVDQWFTDRIVQVKTKCTPKPIEKKAANVSVKYFKDDIPKEKNKYSDWWDESLDLFIVNMLTYRDYNIEEYKKEKMSVYEATKELETFTEDDFSQYIKNMENNISITHYNVYGGNAVYMEIEHLKSAIKTLKNYTSISSTGKERLNRVIENIEGYIKYSEQFTYGD